MLPIKVVILMSWLAFDAMNIAGPNDEKLDIADIV